LGLFLVNNLFNLFSLFSFLRARAPGYKGCRFSGVPFTSEAQLSSGLLPFKGDRSSCMNQPWSENTATIFWRVMMRYHPDFIAWNCFPFHPHEPNTISRTAILKKER